MTFPLHGLPNSAQKALINDGCRITFSQFGEDIAIYFLLANSIKKKGTGFYVDIGAFHPTAHSNTKIFFCLGWKGINIDANEASIALFRAERPNDINVCCGIAPTQGEMTYHKFSDVPAANTFCANTAKKWQDENGWKLSEKIKIPVRTINSVLDEYLQNGQEIDFMDIDIEGMDSQVILTIDLSKYRPAILLIEIHDLDLLFLKKYEVFRYLEANNYQLVFVNNCSFIFIDKKFKTDVNSIDDSQLSTEKMVDIAKHVLDFAVQRLQSGATSSDIERDLIQQGVQTEVAQFIVSQASVHKP